MHRDPEKTIQGILEFLGVDTSRETIYCCREAGLFEKYSDGRARGIEDVKSQLRKGVIGDWKNHFDEVTVRVFAEEAGAMLEELGYE